jgi:hypothetical protein
MNTASFANRSHKNLANLVQEMAGPLGLPPAQTAALDGHSTIAIQVHALPDVMLSVMEERLWIWSQLPELSETRLLHSAAAILTTLEGVEGGQPSMGRGAQGYEFKVQVNLDQLQQAEGLLTVFRNFVEQLDLLCQALDLKGN